MTAGVASQTARSTVWIAGKEFLTKVTPLVILAGLSSSS
jgi:hypothetical protein